MPYLRSDPYHRLAALVGLRFLAGRIRRCTHGSLDARDEAYLSQMNDHMLADIGLHRDNLPWKLDEYQCKLDELFERRK